jgi:hypothetical protein
VGFGDRPNICGRGGSGYGPERQAGASTPPWQIARMVILQAIIIGLVIVATSVAARIIAAADYRRRLVRHAMVKIEAGP